MKQLFTFLFHFFPIQLLFLHFRRSFLLLSFWFILFGMAGGWFFNSIGIPYLFEIPEYLGEVSFISYLIMGIILGFFVMAFHITSYIFYSYRFTFLATLSKPLYRFSINNSLIPLVFYIYYGVIIADAMHQDGYTLTQIIANEVAVVLGSIGSIMLAYTYFFSTLKKPVNQESDLKLVKPFNLIIYKDKKLESAPEDKNVFTYLRNFYSIRIARKSSHYDDEERLNTLQMHHNHAAIYFLALIAFVFILSIFSYTDVFMIPAGASVVLILTTYLMIFGALFSWLKTWTTTIFLLVLFIANTLSGYPKLQRIHKAGGLDYIAPSLPYTYGALDAIATDSIIAYDKAKMIEALDGWKNRQSTLKPKLVILNCSGGGLRSTLFAMATLQKIDSLTSGKFQNSLFLITGSSGGMIGSSFYRELHARRNKGELIGINSRNYYNMLGTDILNSVGFTMAVNDLFFSLKSYKRGGFVYRRDRGYAFDRKFNENTMNLLNKSVFAYREQEQKGEIPLLILNPMLINQGRRLIISPMGMSFLCKHEKLFKTRQSDYYDGVEFSRFFSSRQADSLSFVTALRMSSTFPYITPLVSLPSNPPMEVIDAGARDNDGLLLTIRFLHTFKDWISENTSGVLIVQSLANRPVESAILNNSSETRFDALVKPVGGIVESFSNLQGFTRAEILSYAYEWMDFKMDIVQFDLLTKKNEISLSWHLTNREKNEIYKAVSAKRLQDNYDMLVELLR